MNEPTPVDTIITARWILPVVPRARLLEDCAVVIRNGRILDITTQTDIGRRFQASEILDLPDHILMPGLVNAHGHAAMSLLRGYADDLPLMNWLEKFIWPAEKLWMSEDFVCDGTRLAAAEMIATGTTCFADMYFFPDIAASVALESGLRAQIAFPVLDFPTSWAEDAAEYLRKGLQTYDDFHAQERLQIAFGPHAPYTVSDKPLREIATLAEELQAPIHIHMHETAEEVHLAESQTGLRPLARLDQLGALTPLTQCVHMTQVNAEDVDRLRLTGASVIHCPESNLKLASGQCPVQQLREAGVTLGLGTDGAASNNDLDMLGEMGTAALLGKLTAGDPAALDAHWVLHMATYGSAQALGMESEIGSLEVGKKADLIALCMSDPALLPRYDIASQLVYNNRHIRVTHSWVDGKPLLRDGRLLTLDGPLNHRRAALWQARLERTAKRPQ